MDGTVNECFICDEKFSPGEDLRTVKERGIGTLIRCSERRGDGKGARLVGLNSVKVHEKCAKLYTSEKSINAVRKRPEASRPVAQKNPSGEKLFPFEEKCLFICAKEITPEFLSNESKKPVGKRNRVFKIRNPHTREGIIKAAHQHDDDWSEEHTLTGHCNKVMAAKFLGEPSKVVTGSYDRTLKIWDLRSRACIETKFAGSSCNDLVISDGSGSTIISGHFDKTIRFWDTRAESSSNNIVLQGKVTSLDLSRDAHYLLSCVRDDTLKLLDLRMNQIIGSFSADGFKVGCDWARATFSPDGQYIAVGSSNGSIFIWSVTSNKVESVLKDHVSAVTAVAWHPQGSFLASVDRTKQATIWGDL